MGKHPRIKFRLGSISEAILKKEEGTKKSGGFVRVVWKILIAEKSFPSTRSSAFLDSTFPGVDESAIVGNSSRGGVVSCVFHRTLLV